MYAIRSYYDVGIGTDKPLAKLHVSNLDYTYGSILAQASEELFHLYTKTITTQPVNVETRITSYNVCYTKLLRAKFTNKPT